MKRVKENENLEICLTLFLLASLYGTVSQKFNFNLRIGIIKINSFTRRDY